MNKFLSKDISKFPTQIQTIVNDVVHELDENPALLSCIIKTISKEVGGFIYRTADNSFTTISPTKDSSAFVKRTLPPFVSDGTDIIIEFSCLSGKEVTGCGWYPDQLGFVTEVPNDSRMLQEILNEEQIAALMKDADPPCNLTRSMFYLLSKKTIPKIRISFAENGRTISISENIASTDSGDYILTQYYAKT